eukprot:1069345_1
MFSLLSRLDSRCFYLFTLALLASTCGGFRIVPDTASPINRFALPPDYPSSIGANVVSSYPFDSENDRSLQMPQCCVIEPTQMEPDHRHIVYPEKPLDGLTRSLFGNGHAIGDSIVDDIGIAQDSIKEVLSNGSRGDYIDSAVLRSVPSIQMRSDQDRMNAPLGNSTEKLLDGLNEKLRVNAQVIGDSFEQDIVAIADRDPTEQDSIEEDAILSSISAITPPDESGDNELNYAASFRGDVKECGHDFIEAAVAHTLASSTTNATLDTNYAIYCSVRNNATRAGYGLISIVFVIAMFLFLLPTTFAMDCPNAKFKPIASYKANFDLSTLSQKDLYYWLAFGSNGRWSLAMITAKENANPIGKTNTFKCDESSWGSVSVINTEDELSVPICCISPCSIDEEQKEHKTQSFAVLPSKLHENLKHYNDKVQRPTRKTGQISLVWKIDPKEIRMAYKQGHDDYDDKLGPPETMLAANTHYATCPSTKWCDTGIVNDIVMFLMDRTPIPIRFAYSTDGIFNFETLIQDKNSNVRKVRYTSVLSLFDSMKQPHPSYGVSSADWVLGSFCASCPSTSMTIQITKQDAAMNKKRFEHAFSVGIKGVGVSGGYSYKNIQETSKTLTNGQATTIKAECNAFYLWHYTLSIGTWGTGNAVIPTQLFYCSDRQNPPTCKPRISKQHTDDTCDGHDIASDFGEKDKGPPWTSMHAGRPRPIRLLGQALGKNGREPSFEVSNPGTQNQKFDVAAYLQKNVRMDPKQKQELLNKLKANHKARSSSFGDLLYLDGDNAKRKSLIDQYAAASRFIEKAHHYGHQSGSKYRRSQGNEFPLLRRKYRK